jgi:adenylate cyclase
LDAIAAQLAYHFEAAGLMEPAVDYLLRAGRRAYRLSAPAESVALYRHSLELLNELPRSEACDRRKLNILLALEEALMTTRGWGAPERAASLRRAYRLGRELGETEHLLPVLRALVSVHIARGEHRAALDYAEQLLTLAQETSNALYIGIGKRMLGTGHMFLGHYAQACAYLKAGLRAYVAFTPAQSERSLAAEEDVRLRVWLAYTLLVRGYPAQAVAIGQEALSRAEALDYVGVQGIALTTAGAVFYAACRQSQATLQYARQLLALAEKHTLPSYQSWGTFYRGWALAHQGQPAPGLAEMDAGLEQLESTGTQGSIPLLLTLLAETYAQIEEVPKGETAINRALTLVDETEAYSYLAEMHRVRGVLHLKAQATAKAEGCFERAIDVAQEQAARLWELRATVSLARLWQAQGRAAEAHSRLSAIYGWFTEGLEMPDLVEAREVLDDLKTSS